MDEVEENKFHLYRIPVPTDFLAVDGHRGITIALAYDPPVRGSRKEYMARTMFFQPIVGLTIEEVQAMLSKFDGERHEEPRLPPRAVLRMNPGTRRVAYSTFQVRRVDWKAGEPPPTMFDHEGEAALTVAVFRQRRFTFDPLDTKQKYGLVVDFWHGAQNVRLYQELRNRVRQRVRQQVRR
jgi:hypothetical protein